MDNVRHHEDRSLFLGAEGATEISVLVAIAGIGMCRAISSGAVSAAYACNKLFGPALLGRLEHLARKSRSAERDSIWPLSSRILLISCRSDCLMRLQKSKWGCMSC